MSKRARRDVRRVGALAEEAGFYAFRMHADGDVTYIIRQSPALKGGKPKSQDDISKNEMSKRKVRSQERAIAHRELMKRAQEFRARSFLRWLARIAPPAKQQQQKPLALPPPSSLQSSQPPRLGESTHRRPDHTNALQPTSLHGRLDASTAASETGNKRPKETTPARTQGAGNTPDAKRAAIHGDEASAGRTCPPGGAGGASTTLVSAPNGRTGGFPLTGSDMQTQQMQMQIAEAQRWFHEQAHYQWLQWQRQFLLGQAPGQV